MRKISSVLIALGAALLFGALGLTVFNLRQSNAAGETAAQTVSALKATIPTDGDFYAKEQPETETPDYQLNPEMEMPTVRIDDREYIGVLSIPALGRELPVISSWDYPGLRVAPCRYTGSAYTDDLVIAAHNYASHFGRLRELSQGDSIRFTDTDGNVFDGLRVGDIGTLRCFANDRGRLGPDPVHLHSRRPVPCHTPLQSDMTAFPLLCISDPLCTSSGPTKKQIR